MSSEPIFITSLVLLGALLFIIFLTTRDLISIYILILSNRIESSFIYLNSIRIESN
jgi:hypothetical protein